MNRFVRKKVAVTFFYVEVAGKKNRKLIIKSKSKYIKSQFLKKVLIVRDTIGKNVYESMLKNIKIN